MNLSFRKKQKEKVFSHVRTIEGNLSTIKLMLSEMSHDEDVAITSVSICRKNQVDINHTDREFVCVIAYEIKIINHES